MKDEKKYPILLKPREDLVIIKVPGIGLAIGQLSKEALHPDVRDMLDDLLDEGVDLMERN